MRSLLEINQQPISYWAQRPHSKEDALRTFATMNNQYLVGYFEFNDKRQIINQASEVVMQTGQGHMPSLVRLFWDIGNRWYNEGRWATGAFLAFLDDGMWGIPSVHSKEAPILCWGKPKNDDHTFIIPTGFYLETKGHAKDRTEIAAHEEQWPWSAKVPKIFWRGSGSGVSPYADDSWIQAPRVQLALASKNYGNEDVIDAKLTRAIECAHNSSFLGIRKLGILGDHIPFMDFFNHRYLVDVDGESVSWRLMQLMYSKSLILRVESGLMQWVDCYAEEWRDYVPLKQDLSNLPEIIAWLHANDAECQKIAERSSQIAHGLAYDTFVSEMSEMLFQILSQQK